MAKGFKAGAGGGAPLNFKVVGNPQPASPKENTIWVNTDVKITTWAFSATEPSPAEAGMVWITTGMSSPSEFNALKKNGIQIYPIFAKQYVGGAWVEKTAKSYQGGAWVAWWDGGLFDNGDQYTLHTGGWEQKNIYLTSSNKDKGQVSIGGTLSINANTQNASATVTTKNPVDLSSFNTLNINVLNVVGTAYLAIHDTETGDLFSMAKAQINFSGAGKRSLDISNIYGKYYITFACNSNRSSQTDKIWLE